MNAPDAASVQLAGERRLPDLAEVARRLERRADGLVCGVSERLGDTRREGGRQSARVKRRVNTADDGDPERSAEQARGIVDGRADARLVL